MMTTDRTTTSPILEISGLRKTFGAVTALDGIDFTVAPGEVVALCGDNGAGKSTLVKIISGSLRPDAGVIAVDGTEVKFESPQAATSRGIATVYQDLALCDNLDIASNLFLGHEVVRAPFLGLFKRLQTPEMYRLGRGALDTLTRLPKLSTPVSELSGGQRQAVAVGRALLWGSRLVLLDEPTAALGVEQTGHVLDLVTALASRGMGVVLISHSLPDVFKVSDRVSVLRLGRNAGEFVTRQSTPEEIVGAITGGIKVGER